MSKQEIGNKKGDKVDAEIILNDIKSVIDNGCDIEIRGSKDGIKIYQIKKTLIRVVQNEV